MNTQLCCRVDDSDEIRSHCSLPPALPRQWPQCSFCFFFSGQFVSNVGDVQYIFFSPGGGATSLHSDRFRPYLRLRLEFASLVDHRVVLRGSYSSGINVRWCLTVKYPLCSVINTHFWMSAFSHTSHGLSFFLLRLC